MSELIPLGSFPDGRFATQHFDSESGTWDRHVVVYTADNSPARNVLPARVTACERAGGNMLVHLDAGEPLVAKLTPAACEALALSPGTAVHLVIKAQALRRLA